MKKTKPILFIIFPLLVLALLARTFYYSREGERRSNAVIKTAPLVEALGYSSPDFYFPNKKVNMFGRSAFEFIQNNDAVRYYADPKTGEVICIKGTRGSGPALSEEELIAKKDAIVAAVKGEEILKLCKERGEAEGLSGNEYKCYIDGVSVSVADILLFPDGSVNTAVFQNTAVSGSSSGAISKEDAVAAAKKEAESFLKKKNCLDGRILDESRITAQKTLIKGRTVWLIELHYGTGNAEGIEYYFNISVNPKNGRIIENANNLS